ncbi:MAG: 4Fe-4S single cluster domain-containing protein [Thermodesulfobacteriota bacterium]
MTRLRLYSLAYPVRSLGPGLRAALWVAGCDRKCPGCLSPEMQPFSSGRLIEIGALARKLLSVGHPLTGLTVSGGEPFDQAGALLDLLDRLKPTRPDWDVLVYTGYTRPEIESVSETGRRLLSHIDILIDGPYRAEIPGRHPLAGSGNQEIIYLSPLGESRRQLMDDFPAGRFDLGLGPRGLSTLIGVGDPLRRSRVRHGLGLSTGRA